MVSDLQGLETASSGTLDTLNTVVAWLHQEGYYAAESALLGEVESRYPDHDQKLHNSPFHTRSSPTQSIQEQSTTPRNYDVVELTIPNVRSQGNRGTSSPLELSAPPSVTSSPIMPQRNSAIYASGFDDIEEYEDDNDPGYWRIPMSPHDSPRPTTRLQSAFAANSSISSDKERTFVSTGNFKTHSNSNSRVSSLELPALPLVPPVVGDVQQSHLPPMPPKSGANHSSSTISVGKGPVKGFHTRGASDAEVIYSTKDRWWSGYSDKEKYGHGHKESVERRHAGTAQWVFDRQNSAGSDAYRSLVSYLDQQSPRTQPLPLGSAEGSETEGPLNVDMGSGRAPTDAATNNETTLPENTTPDADEVNKQQQEQESTGKLHAVQMEASMGDILEEASCIEPLSQRSTQRAQKETIPRIPSLKEPVLQEAEDSVDRVTDKLESSSLRCPDVINDDLPPSHDAKKVQNTDTEQLQHRRAAVDPFSFPVASSSEPRERDAGQLFASWTSFKNMSSPTPSGGGTAMSGGYCSTEEDGRAQQRRSAFSPLVKQTTNRWAKDHHYRILTALGGDYDGDYDYEDDNTLYEYNESAIEEKFDIFNLRIVQHRGTTGFEVAKELPLQVDDLIAGRYQIMDLLGQAAFSRAVQALDLKTGELVCLKVVKNNKDYFDQSLDEIKVLRYVNAEDPGDEYGILRLLDWFYYKEHLILVTELLRANLYEFAKHDRNAAAKEGQQPYFTLDTIRHITRQILKSLVFLHSLGLIHADLKPENILMKSYSRQEVKIIDLGSSCFVTDRASSYVQSRSYRAPEVILGLSYGQKIDIWSVGCIVAELITGQVLFHNSSVAAILARIEGILGHIPQHMLSQGRFTRCYYTADGKIYERDRTGRTDILQPKKTSLSHRVPTEDAEAIDFISCLLQIDPGKRPTALEALDHPWLAQRGSASRTGHSYYSPAQ